MKKLFSSTILGYPAWPLLIVLAGGAGAGFSYKFHQVVYIYPQAWRIYPLGLVIPNIIIGMILSAALWIGYCTFLSWASSKPMQTLLTIDSLSFLPLISMFGVSCSPVDFSGAVVNIFILWKISFFLISLRFRGDILPQIKIHRHTLIDIVVLGIFCAFIWLNTSELGLGRWSLGRGVNAHLSLKAAQLAKYFQYPAWNPEMYAGGWPFIYGQVYGYLWYWLIGFFPISPILFKQFVGFETFLPMYFMIIFSSLSFYLLLKKSFRLSRAASIFGGLIYLFNFYMQGIIIDETNCVLAYLVFPAVFLAAERGLKKRNLLYACLSGLLINFLMPSTYAHPESFYIFYFIIGVFYLSAAISYYKKKDLFPIISLMIFGASHLVFLNYYLPIFEYMHVFKEAVHLAGEERLTNGFGPYAPLFYPFYIGVVPAFLIVYAFFRFRKIINKNFPAPTFLGIFSFLMFIFLSIAQFGKELPVYSWINLPDKYIFPFVRSWMRFAPGLFFFHYIMACSGLDRLLKDIDESFKKRWVSASFLFLVALMIAGKFYFRGGVLNINFFVDPYKGVIRDVEFFWIYIIVGAVAISSLLFINKRYLRLVVFFSLSVIPLIHYMEPALQTFSYEAFKINLLHLKDICSPKIEQSPYAAGMPENNPFLLPYIERNPRDAVALNAFNNYMSKHNVLPSHDNILQGYLSDKGLSRFIEMGRATDGFSFTYHMFPLANVVFNMGGNVGRPHQWRWFPQFDYFFPWKVSADSSWYIEPGDLIGRFWTLNLLGVKHLAISEEDCLCLSLQSGGVDLSKNPVKNSPFESWVNAKIPIPEGWTLVGSGGSIERGPGAVVTLFSGPVTAKGREWELVQDVMKLTKDTSMRGKSYVLGAWVKTSTPDSASVLIRDYYSDARSGYHSGSGKWEFLTVTKTIRQDAPLVEAILMIEEKNTVAQFDRPILLKGGAALEATLKANALQGLKGNLIKNSPFEDWVNAKIPIPEGWTLVGSGGSIERGPGAVVTLFSGPVTAKGREWELVQDVMKLTKDTSMRGKSYVLGAWVKTSTPNSVNVAIRDYYSDARSGYHSGSGEWEFLTITKTIRQDAPLVEAILMIEEKNTVAQFNRPILLKGGAALEATLKANAPQGFEETKRVHDLTVEGESVIYERKILLLRNDSALPLMFLANSYELVSPALEKEKKWEALNHIDYRNAVLLEEEPVLPQLGLRGNRLAEDNLSDRDSVSIIDIRGNIAAARVDVASAYKYLFYSDNYHPGWLALIDGKPIKVYRADLAFKAIVVPEGKHLIWFEFRPISLWIGIYVSSLTILAIVIAASKKRM